MVYGIVSRIAAKAIRSSGIYLIERYTKTFTRYDKALFGRLYGKSGGRGVRHGRDIGAAVGGLMAVQKGDDLDGQKIQPKYSSRPKSKAYRRRGVKYNPRRRNYCPSDRIRN